MEQRDLVIEVNDLRKYYPSKERKSLFKSVKKEVKALNGVELKVNQGEIYTLLGPNGAGKTTLIKILTTLLHPSSGKVKILGMDVIKQAKDVRMHINAMLMGERSVYWKLSGRQNLEFFGALYYIPKREVEERIDFLIKELRIEDIIDRPVESYSSGQKYKISFAKALINDPEILFLDEPTATLDPRSAREMRELIKKVNEQGTTIFLTTHNMMEADEMSHYISILDYGQIIAEGTPQSLKDQFIEDETIHVEIKIDRPINGHLKEIETIPTVVKVAQHIPSNAKEFPVLSVILNDDNGIIDTLRVLQKYKVKVIAMRTKQPTLEDVFLSLTGRRLDEDTSLKRGGK